MMKRNSLLPTPSPSPTKQPVNCFLILILITIKILNNMNMRFLNVLNFIFSLSSRNEKNKDLIYFYNHTLLSHLFLLIFDVSSFSFLCLSLITLINMPQFLM